jgi:hypothetical protein
VIDGNEVATTPEGRGWWIAAVFVGFAILAAILLVLYVLLWDGGAHT